MVESKCERPLRRDKSLCCIEELHRSFGSHVKPGHVRLVVNPVNRRHFGHFLERLQNKDSTMSDKTALKLERGNKRTCQNPDCGERFYDLNRSPITCPVCNSVYTIALQAPPQTITRPTPRPFKPPARISSEPKEEVPAVEDGEELAALEGEEEAAPAEEDDTFIEEVDEETPDMADLVDAPAENEEKQ